MARFPLQHDLLSMVATRIIRLLSIISLLFGLFSMAPGHAALPMSAGTEAKAGAQTEIGSGRCAAMEQSGDPKEQGQPDSRNDCMATCALSLGYHRSTPR
jgi:hypothetical protein